MSELIYGRHAVFHLISAGRRRAFRLCLQKGREGDFSDLAELAGEKKIPLDLVAPSFFQNKLGPQATHQGVVVEAAGYPYVDFADLQESLLLILDEIQDPQNLGALCRSAHLFGVGGVIIPETHAASVTPGACHASVGAVEYLKVARVSSISNTLELLKKDKFWIYGADRGAKQEVHEEKFPPKVALVIGSEEKGLRRLVRERCDILLRVPTAERAAIGSLNASVAGGVLLYEIFRQLTPRKLPKVREVG